MSFRPQLIFHVEDRCDADIVVLVSSIIRLGWKKQVHVNMCLPKRESLIVLLGSKPQVHFVREQLDETLLLSSGKSIEELEDEVITALQHATT